MGGTVVIRWLIYLLLALDVVGSFFTLKTGKVIARGGVTTAPPTQGAVVPPVKTFARPLAILVLDVSGSMQQADPQACQAAGVRHFLRLYGTLVRDALVPGDIPRAAVVLFATGAQVLEWPEAGNRWSPFLAVPEQAEELDRLVDRSLLAYLEKQQGAADPRQGQYTDYCAAVEAVRWTIERAGKVGPPCVLFMTDGRDEPFPALVPKGAAARQAVAQQFGVRLLKQIREDYPEQPACVLLAQTAVGTLTNRLRAECPPTLRLGTLPWDPIRDALGDPVRDARDNQLWLMRRYFKGTVGADPPPPATAEQRKGRLRELLRQLAEARYPLAGTQESAPLAWEAVYLDASGKEEALEPLRELMAPLARTVEVWRLPAGGLIRCTDAQTMQAAFLEVLGRWLSLDQEPLVRGARNFFVEPKTAGIGLIVHTVRDIHEVRVVPSGGQPLPLVRAAVAAERIPWVLARSQPTPGPWQIEGRGGDPLIEGGTLWTRRSYRWLFADLPVRYSPLMSQARLKLALYDLKSGREQSPGSVYDLRSLPSSVTGTLFLADGGPVALSFAWSAGASNDAGCYHAPFPNLAGAVSGDLRLRAQLEGLVFQGTSRATGPQRVESTLRLQPTLDFQLQGTNGTPVGGVALDGLIPGGASRP